jgi:hypothetical protein
VTKLLIEHNELETVSDESPGTVSSDTLVLDRMYESDEGSSTNPDEPRVREHMMNS